jgi:hypothetical protein
MQDAIICKNCGQQFHGKFCSNCGEKVYTEHDKSFGHFLAETFHFITHWDSKILRSWWLVMTRPGFVSSQISYGIRRPYYAPSNLFIIGVILYLLFPVMQGLNMPMKYHLSEMYGELADHMVYTKMIAKKLTFEQVAEKFDHKSPAFAKVLLLIIIPLCALILQLLFKKRGRYFFDHITLSSEVNAFYLFFTFLIMPLLFVLSIKAYHIIAGGPGRFYLTDDISVPVHLAVLGIYIFFAVRTFYGLRIVPAILKSALFLGAHWIIVYTIYRLILFCTVLLFI